jgi:hypothetical protein
MNLKQLGILLVLVVIAGAVGLKLRKNQSASWENGNPEIGRKLLGEFPVNDVTHIAIQQGTNEVNLVKTNEIWRVRERDYYPANYSGISDFLIKLKDVKIVQSEKVGPSQWARLALVAGQGTNAALAVDMRDQNDKPVRALLVGKEHVKKSSRPSPMGGMGDESWPDGRYVRVGSTSEDVALISDALSNIEPRPDTWLNKDFFKVENVRTMAVAFPVATNSWKLTRDTATADWKLEDAKAAEKIDASKTSGLAGTFMGMSFSDVNAPGRAGQLGLDKPTVVTLDTFDNFAYTIKVGPKTNDSYPLAMMVSARLPKERVAAKDEKAEDKARLDKEFKDNQKKFEDKLGQETAYTNWIYLVSSWSLEPVLKERGQLLVEKKEEPKKDESATNSVPVKESEAGSPVTAKSDVK